MYVYTTVLELIDRQTYTHSHTHVHTHTHTHTPDALPPLLFEQKLLGHSLKTPSSFNDNTWCNRYDGTPTVISFLLFSSIEAPNSGVLFHIISVNENLPSINQTTTSL